MQSLAPAALTPAERRSLLLASLVLESGPAAVPHGGSGDGGELAAAHALAERLVRSAGDAETRRRVAASLRAAALAVP